MAMTTTGTSYYDRVVRYINGDDLYWNGTEEIVVFSDTTADLVLDTWDCEWCSVVNPHTQVSYCVGCGAPRPSNNVGRLVKA